MTRPKRYPPVRGLLISGQYVTSDFPEHTASGVLTSPVLKLDGDVEHTLAYSLKGSLNFPC